MNFQPVDPHPDYSKLEQDLLAFWDKEKIFEKSVEARQGNEQFVFYEGPPSANARPGIHHVLARVFKDLFPRYQTMRGRRVERRAGWDTHGLPIEVQVEKEHGLKTKSDIENIIEGDRAASIKEFNQRCRELVFRYKKDWDALTRRIGFWLDLKNPYITYENSYISALWGVIKKIYDRGLFYKGQRVSPYCPRCGTTLSSHELAQGYQDVSQPSLYVTFPVVTDQPRVKKGDLLVAWTTTPWTLPGNVALAVGPDIRYVRAQVADQTYIVAKDRLEILDQPKVRAEFSGRQLIGASYQPIFDSLTQSEKTKLTHTAVPADFVRTNEGSGIVHTAVMYGEDDFELGQKIGLPMYHTVGEDGRFNQRLPQFKGQLIQQASPKIIADLQARGRVLKLENYSHSYPHCWRCSTPLIYYAKDSWFIAMSKLRPDLISQNKTITWLPEHLRQGRFGQWLDELKDWSFSRERYWGTPLPFWICDQCSDIRVIGSSQELLAQISNSTSSTRPDKLNDLHRPQVDDISWPCGKCSQGRLRREPYVCDVWFDSGAMPFATGRYPSRYPADFICEAVDQTRGWFYTLLAVASALGEKAPYRNVISLGHVVDQQGQKMSKSKGNIIDPWQVIEKYGVDAVRFWFYTMNQAGETKFFIESELQAAQRGSLTILWNVYSFFLTRANVQKFQIPNLKSKTNPTAQILNQKLIPTSKNVLDDWIVSRLHQTIKIVTDSLDRYDPTKAGRSIQSFIDDLSTWYVRRSRTRQDEQFLATLRNVLADLARLMAPLTPFMAERIYRGLTGELSVHLADWPKDDQSLVDNLLIERMRAGRDIVSLGHELRAKAGLKVRQPLASLTISGYGDFDDQIKQLIADELNLERVIVKPKGDKKVLLDTKLSARLKERGKVREIIRAIQVLRQKSGLKLGARARIIWRAQTKTDARLLERNQQAIERATDCLIEPGPPADDRPSARVDTIELSLSDKIDLN